MGDVSTGKGRIKKFPQQRICPNVMTNHSTLLRKFPLDTTYEKSNTLYA